MSLSPFDQPLTDDEFASIGRIVTQWGSTESAVGATVAHLYGLKDQEAMRELVFRQPLQRKLDLLVTLVKRVSSRTSVTDALRELCLVHRKFKAARDVLAHGFPIIDLQAVVEETVPQRGVRLTSHDKFLAAADFPNQLLAADYAAEISAWLFLAVLLPAKETTLDSVLPARPLALQLEG